MGIRLMNLVWESSVPVPERLTLLALADIANDYGRECYPSQRYLMRKAAASESTIRRHLNALKSDGILTWELKGRHHVYTISVRRLQALALPPIEDPQDDTGQSDRCPDGVDTGQSDRCPDDDTGQSDRSTPVNLTGHTGQSDRLSLSYPPVEPKEPPPTPPQGAQGALDDDGDFLITADAAIGGFEADFETWWAQWPRKIAKQKALDSYRRARKKKVPAELLLTTAAKQLATWYAAGRAHDKIPHASTWLNQERWNDAIEQPKFKVINNPQSPWDGIRIDNSDSPWAADMGWTS